MSTTPLSWRQIERSHGRGPHRRRSGGLPVQLQPYGRVATSSLGVPGWESIRRGSFPRSPTDRVAGAMPAGALVVCFALTPYAVIHQGPPVRTLLKSSPLGDS